MLLVVLNMIDVIKIMHHKYHYITPISGSDNGTAV